MSLVCFSAPAIFLVPGESFVLSLSIYGSLFLLPLHPHVRRRASSSLLKKLCLSPACSPPPAWPSRMCCCSGEAPGHRPLFPPSMCTHHSGALAWGSASTPFHDLLFDQRAMVAETSPSLAVPKVEASPPQSPAPASCLHTPSLACHFATKLC